MEQASLTSLMSAFARVRHAQRCQQPVFDDTCARELLTDEEYSALCSHIAKGAPFLAPDLATANLPQDKMVDTLVARYFAPTPVFRSRIAEHELAKAMREEGVSQYVILGAGLDTFAFRNPLAAELSVFEIDLPLTQRDKRRRIAQAGWSTPDYLHFVEADLSEPSWICTLTQAGFDPAQKSFVGWLGVAYYLEQAAIEALFAQLKRLLSTGSVLFFDFADAGLLSSSDPRTKSMVAMAQAAGEPMREGFPEEGLRKLLERHGFALARQWDSKEIQQVAPKSSELKAFKHIHFAKAARR